MLMGSLPLNEPSPQIREGLCVVFLCHINFLIKFLILVSQRDKGNADTRALSELQYYMAERSLRDEEPHYGITSEITSLSNNLELFSRCSSHFSTF